MRLFLEDSSYRFAYVLATGLLGGIEIEALRTGKRNIKVVEAICECLAKKLGKPVDHFKSLITFIKDPPWCGP